MPLGDAAGEAEAARRDLSPAAPPSRDTVRPEVETLAPLLCREEGDPRSGVDLPPAEEEEEEEAPSFLSDEELLEPDKEEEEEEEKNV